MCLVRTHFRFFVFIRLFKNSICNLFYSMSAHLVVIVVVVAAILVVVVIVVVFILLGCGALSGRQERHH